MNQKNLRLVQTAMLLALLIALQAITKPLGQFVTGSFVNCILAVTALAVGLSGGIAVALLSPVFAFLLGIAPNLITVIPIMLGNLCYVVLLHLIGGRKAHFSWHQPLSVAVAAGTKFLVLYFLVVKVICGLASGLFMGKKVGKFPLLAPKMLQLLPAMFSWPQLVTALIGGAVALAILPVLQKFRNHQDS